MKTPGFLLALALFGGSGCGAPASAVSPDAPASRPPPASPQHNPLEALKEKVAKEPRPHALFTYLEVVYVENSVQITPKSFDVTLTQTQRAEDGPEFGYAEVTVRGDGKPSVGQPAQVRTIFVQVTDPNEQGPSRNVTSECVGQGTVTFESLPPLPASWPKRETRSTGKATAVVNITMECAGESAKYGTVKIEGRAEEMAVVLQPK